MTAVDHLSLAIPRGQCFGLLGINGMLLQNSTFNPSQQSICKVHWALLLNVW